jgi:hypothetical protein
MVEAGTYTNDFATINTAITIEGVGGMVHLVATVAPPDGKAILTTNTDCTLDSIEFSGAVVPDGNGAGIRYQGGNLVIDNCYFHGNQEGLLAASDPTGTITINNSEFAGNGSGTGYTHNLYVNEIQTLTINNSYFHDAVVGHEIKSRAATTIIENSRIAEGTNGTGSYDIDLPNGGTAIIRNNVIEKGPNSQNSNMIAFGEEGAYTGSALTVTGNTAINDHGGGTTMVWNDTGTPAVISGNTAYGLTSGQIVNGPAASGDNTLLALSLEPAFDTSHPFLSPVPVCFVSGTRILAREGQAAVENLRVGQEVAVACRGGREFRPVKWLGWRTIDTAAHPAPEMACPVRIRRGAFADGVPHSDLYLSPDHAVFVDGALIPVRLLANGGTIAQDMDRKRVRYHHVELEAHSVLIAEGLDCESYLDTGNRTIFANAGAAMVLHPALVPDSAHRRWQTDACAPLLTDEAAVAPTWRRLAERSAEIGLPIQSMAATTGHDLRLVIDGQPVRPASTSSGRHVFILPRPAATVRIVSRWTVPAAMMPPTDDRRRLGVNVQRIVLQRGGDRAEMALDDPALADGWWAPERTGSAMARWTSGDAALPLPEGTQRVELQIATGTLYPVAETRPNAA